MSTFETIERRVVFIPPSSSSVTSVSASATSVSASASSSSRTNSPLPLPATARRSSHLHSPSTSSSSPCCGRLVRHWKLSLIVCFIFLLQLILVLSYPGWHAPDATDFFQDNNGLPRPQFRRNGIDEGGEGGVLEAPFVNMTQIMERWTPGVDWMKYENISIIYTWVNGSEPDYQALRKRVGGADKVSYFQSSPLSLPFLFPPLLAPFFFPSSTLLYSILLPISSLPFSLLLISSILHFSFGFSTPPAFPSHLISDWRITRS
jgi:hypothetical protein